MTIPCSDLERRLLDALRHAGRSISAQELGAAVGISARTCRALLSHLRRDHAAPIASNSRDGFYWPKSQQDIDHTVNQIESRIKEMTQVAEGVRAGGEWLFGNAETKQMGLL